MARSTTALRERIENSVAVNENGCWIWQKHISQTGYGQISVGSRSDSSRQNTVAHRASFKSFVGPLIKGMQIDHLCRVRACVNPEHLEQVTPKENVHRSNAVYKHSIAKAHCPQGHEYTEANTYERETPAGGRSRSCIECSKARTKARYKLAHPEAKEGMPLWAQFAAKTHCKNGHEFTDENTYRYGNSRKCKACGLLNKNRANRLRQAVGVA